MFIKINNDHTLHIRLYNPYLEIHFATQPDIHSSHVWWENVSKLITQIGVSEVLTN